MGRRRAAPPPDRTHWRRGLTRLPLRTMSPLPGERESAPLRTGRWHFHRCGVGAPPVPGLGDQDERGPGARPPVGGEQSGGRGRVTRLIRHGGRQTSGAVKGRRFSGALAARELPSRPPGPQFPSPVPPTGGQGCENRRGGGFRGYRESCASPRTTGTRSRSTRSSRRRLRNTSSRGRARRGRPVGSVGTCRCWRRTVSGRGHRCLHHATTAMSPHPWLPLRQRHLLPGTSVNLPVLGSTI